MTTVRTPSQTVGPYLAIAMLWADGPFVVSEGTPGAIRIRGRLFDGDGEPIADGMIESWQADAGGRFAVRGATDLEPAGFRGFGRSCTDDDGDWELVTVKPGTVAADDGRPQAPHLDVMVFARGLLKHLVTRIYFADEVEANAADPVLASVEPARRPTLLARPDGDDAYRLDLHLQGPDETVFFHA